MWNKEKSSKAKSSSGIWIRLTWFLLVISVGLGGHIVYHVFFAEQPRLAPLTLPVEPLSGGEAEEIVLLEGKNFEDYENFVQSRDVFAQPFPSKGGRASDAIVQPRKIVSSANINLAKNYRLVGIILDEDSKAIIEDIENKETLFLSQGDSLGNAVLEKIEEGKVILLIRDKRVELMP